ncbi:MAG: hypothetical protein GY715_03665 [Planctomycetes bacterium]|nr:hypothetical protein [Planctomycetota bacterium]
MLRHRRIAVLALAALALPATVLAMQSGSAGEPIQIFRTHEQSVVQIYSVGGTAVKLNTATGAVHSLRGNTGSSGTSYWWLNVPPVNTAGTGMFEIQRATDSGTETVFLVDVQNGSTWLLRLRGNQNGAWQAIPDQR